MKPQAERYIRMYISMLTSDIRTSVYEHDIITAAIDEGRADDAELAVQVNWRHAADRLEQGDRDGWRARGLVAEIGRRRDRASRDTLPADSSFDSSATLSNCRSAPRSSPAANGLAHRAVRFADVAAIGEAAFVVAAPRSRENTGPVARPIRAHNPTSRRPGVSMT